MKKLMVFVLLSACTFLVGCSNEAANIGIIGGADGPTAVFVSPDINWMHICGLVGLIIAVVLAVLIYRKKKKK